MEFTRIDDDQRRRFEEDGFLVVPGAITRGHVDALLAAGDAAVASPTMLDRQRMDGGRYDGFRNAIVLGEPFERLLCNPRTVPIVVQLMSANIQLHTSHLIHKHPDPAGAPPNRRDPGWHRDITTVDEDLGAAGNRRLEIKVMYQLSDAREPCSGVTMFARGSHRWTSRPRFGADGDPPDAVAPALAPGDAVLFENRTYHAGGANRSGAIRKSVIFGYSFRWMRPDDWLEQPAWLLDRLDAIGRELVTPMRHRLPDGRFEPCADRRHLRSWAERHGVVSAALLAEGGTPRRP